MAIKQSMLSKSEMIEINGCWVPAIPMGYYYSGINWIFHKIKDCILIFKGKAVAVIEGE